MELTEDEASYINRFGFLAMNFMFAIILYMNKKLYKFSRLRKHLMKKKKEKKRIFYNLSFLGQNYTWDTQRDKGKQKTVKAICKQNEKKQRRNIITFPPPFRN
jgi:hypothetical protein